MRILSHLCHLYTCSRTVDFLLRTTLLRDSSFSNPVSRQWEKLASRVKFPMNKEILRDAKEAKGLRIVNL